MDCRCNELSEYRAWRFGGVLFVSHYDKSRVINLCRNKAGFWVPQNNPKGLQISHFLVFPFSLIPQHLYINLAECHVCWHFVFWQQILLLLIRWCLHCRRFVFSYAVPYMWLSRLLMISKFTVNPPHRRYMKRCSMRHKILTAVVQPECKALYKLSEPPEFRKRIESIW